MAEVYIDQLAVARDRLLAERREIVAAVAKATEAREAEEWRQGFMNVQAAIEAIDRALQDERRQIVEKSLGGLIQIGPI
jgi:hypothetical protein